jgi:hypothetical protein
MDLVLRRLGPKFDGTKRLFPCLILGSFPEIERVSGKTGCILFPESQKKTAAGDVPGSRS